MPLRSGDTLINNFVIQHQLGQGGFGCAYLAEDKSLGVQRVIKELLVGHQADETVTSRFVDEARTMASLNDPHVVTVHMLIKPDDFPGVRQYFIVMEYMKGGSLDQWIERERRLPIEQAVRITIEVCRGLECAHKRNIVHRDIKPHNILLSEDGQSVKVTDWGLAHLPNISHNTFGQPGTLIYMSPEQARANLQDGRRLQDRLDGRSDLYSVGVMLYEMLTGQTYIDFARVQQTVRAHFFQQRGIRPFDELGFNIQHALQGDTQRAILEAILNAAPTPPRQYNPQIPSKLEAIVLTVLAKDPAQRYQTAVEMIAALQSLGSEPAGNARDVKRAQDLIQQARTAIRERKFSQALTWLLEARSLAPQETRIYAELAIAYNALEKHGDACRALEEALKVNPNDASLYRDLGVTYHTIGQRRQALQALERSLQLDPNQSTIKKLLSLWRNEMSA
ncbi:MAG: serine/threonine-protein kinase [Anaerolineae bacterium]